MTPESEQIKSASKPLAITRQRKWPTSRTTAPAYIGKQVCQINLPFAQKTP
jgi:hypothetical protein